MTTRAASVLGGLIAVMLALATFALVTGGTSPEGPSVTPTASDLSPSPEDTFVAIASPTPSPSADASPTQGVLASPTGGQIATSSPSPQPSPTPTTPAATPTGTEVVGTAVTGPPVATGVIGLIPFSLGALGLIVRRRR